MASLGQELKRAREEREIALNDISNVTHIGVRFLQAIENDSYDVLPGGVFNRAFVRKFAKHVGYDEEQAIRLYEEQLEEMGGEPQRRYYTGLDDLESRPSSGNGLLLSLVALMILSAGAYVAYSYFNSKTRSSNPVVSQASTSPTPTPQATIASTPSPPPTPITTSSPTTENAVSSALRLQLIAASEECWVKIKTDDSPKAQIAVLQPGETREFTANDKIVLNVGKLSALKIMINGRPAKREKLARKPKSVIAENVVITKDNYQKFVD